MIELKNDSLVFTFPEVHPDAALTMQFINGVIGRGRGRDDLSALITVVEELDIS